MNPLETQIGGAHYKDMKIQPMEYSMANKLDACQHSVVKYVSRFRTKDGRKDLEKAKHIIDMLIQFEYGGAPAAKANNTEDPEFAALLKEMAGKKPAKPAPAATDKKLSEVLTEVFETRSGAASEFGVCGCAACVLQALLSDILPPTK